MINIHANPGSSLAAVITCTASVTGIPDMTTVVSSVLKVRGPGGKVATWDVAVDSVSASEIVLRHVYVDDVDFARVGVYQLWAENTVAGGVAPVASKDVLYVIVVPRWTTI